MAKAYTVGQINSYIRNMFDTDVLLERVSISAEISNLKYHTSGHIYLTLKDQTGTIAAVMYAGDARNLRFRLADGMKVVATGRISVYEAQGKYQLYIRSVEKVGSGDLYERYLALKKELEEMGMFDPRYKKPIPAYARRVGIVTASTGAAIQDIVNISTRRNPYVQLILYPAKVQGAGAAETIARGIEYLDTKAHVDTIIVGRGGGSIEDLWAFNEEIVARAIFHCQTPIISAVGHETDYTIADYVSDLRAPTPSAAAELAVYEWTTLLNRMKQAKNRMATLVSEKLSVTKLSLSRYQALLEAHAPLHELNEKRQRYIDIEEKLMALLERKCENLRQGFVLRMTRIEANSPLKRLESGYAYVAMEDGNQTKAVRSIADVKPKDCLHIHVTDGVITASVEETEGKIRIHGE